MRHRPVNHAHHSLGRTVGSCALLVVISAVTAACGSLRPNAWIHNGGDTAPVARVTTGLELLDVGPGDTVAFYRYPGEDFSVAVPSEVVIVPASYPSGHGDAMEGGARSSAQSGQGFGDALAGRGAAHAFLGHATSSTVKGAGSAQSTTPTGQSDSQKGQANSEVVQPGGTNTTADPTAGHGTAEPAATNQTVTPEADSGASEPEEQHGANLGFGNSSVVVTPVLRVEKRAATGVVALGAETWFEVSVANVGPRTIDEVLVVDRLNDRFSVVDSGGAEVRSSPTGSIIVWQRTESMPPKAKHVFRVRVRLTDRTSVSSSN